jgi:hypothetical protein
MTILEIMAIVLAVMLAGTFIIAIKFVDKEK